MYSISRKKESIDSANCYFFDKNFMLIGLIFEKRRWEESLRKKYVEKRNTTIVQKYFKGKLRTIYEYFRNDYTYIIYNGNLNFKKIEDIVKFVFYGEENDILL